MATQRDSQRPYVICHMVPSIDGRIVTRRWDLPASVYEEYEGTAQTFGASAWMIGRISMEPYAGKARVPVRKKGSPIPRKDFIAKRDAGSYAIALDPSGKLTWKSSAIDDEHVITVLTEQVSDDYLAFLQAKGVTYVFGGKTEVNLGRVLRKLRKEFGIEKLLLEGGGGINGSFLAAGLIDELSVLVAPVADGSIGTPTLFDAKEGRGAVRHLKLESFERRSGDLLWLRYTLER
ncbi:RibD family protein [Aggregicoccus sp. 17bor-14]|uniref:RibD family protein n=1 Tax=Myxococcaceae TaxID=31 RepID=UPI00129C1C9A|nr:MULTISPECIES: RibD family protein [Myxococcaceae]MBF5045626.1 RibD family protein [Simulacricoccus sp. 17bor-14]MRI91363.1 RibD family protein [Aggregicoccus sp. 17bor-14]